jgi:hypothetical protein
MKLLGKIRGSNLSFFFFETGQEFLGGASTLPKIFFFIIVECWKMFGQKESIFQKVKLVLSLP